MTQEFQFWVFIWRKWNTTLKRYINPHIHWSIIYNSQNTEET